MTQNSTWHVYLLRCSDNSLYDAPFRERSADINTHVSIIIDGFILVLYSIPKHSQVLVSFGITLVSPAI